MLADIRLSRPFSDVNDSALHGYCAIMPVPFHHSWHYCYSFPVVVVLLTYSKRAEDNSSKYFISLLFSYPSTASNFLGHSFVVSENALSPKYFLFLFLSNTNAAWNATQSSCGHNSGRSGPLPACCQIFPFQIACEPFLTFPPGRGGQCP